MAADPVFYRIVSSNPPRQDDFLSQLSLGRTPRRATPHVLRLWDGISVYETEGQARDLARDSPHLGGYIAAVRIPEGGAIRYERATGRRGHCTLWGKPEDLLALVVSIVAV
jgi:hypothetical protein